MPNSNERDRGRVQMKLPDIEMQKDDSERYAQKTIARYMACDIDISDNEYLIRHAFESGFLCAQKRILELEKETTEREILCIHNTLRKINPKATLIF